MPTSPRRLPIALSLLLLLVPTLMFAQTSGAVLEGTVTDETNSAVPGVTVTATNVATGVARSVVTESDGTYRTPTLLAGRYTVTAELSGFSTVTVRDVDLHVATTRDLDITIRAAAVQEAITVTADAPLIATSPSIGTVVSQNELENLPLNGRQFANLASLAPGTSLGVNPDPTKPGQLVVALNGGIGRNVNYLIDGGDNTDDTIGGALQNFNLEAVQEFQIQTQQYKAEFGRSTGGVLTVVTKTGTNEFGGSLYGFFRDKSLNARTESESIRNVDKQDYERSQYGLSFGGPIIRDKAHFFLTYDKTDRTTGFALSSLVTAIFPDVAPTLAVDYEDQLITGKATWAISPSQQLQARYGSQEYSDVYNAQALSTPDNVGVLNSKYSSFLAGHTAQVGRSAVNDFLYQYSTFDNSILPVTDAPTEVFANGVNAGQNFNTPQTTEQIKHQFKDDFAFTTMLGNSRHSFKAGFNWIHEPTLGGSFSSGLGGRYTYIGNNRESGIRLIEFNSGFSRFSIPVDQYSVYLQDDWQITEKLLLNGGLRYDRWTGFDLDQSSSSLWQTLRTQTTYNEDYLQDFREGSGQVEDDTNNWGPRLGFTYDLFNDSRHMVRGGWGLYYDFPYTNATLLFPSIPIQSNFGATYSHANVNGIRNADGSLYRVGQPLPANQLVPGSSTPTDVASPTIQAPESMQTSLGYSWQVTNNLGLTFDLVNIEYSKIPFRFRGNPFVDTNNNGRIDAGEPRRFSQFGNFRIWYGEGEADYTGANIGVRSRISDRLELQGFYTWSEAEGNVLAGADEFRLTNTGHQPELGAVGDQSVNPFDPACDECFGPLNTDARHRFTLSALYRAPLDINVGTIIRYRSALPYTEWTGADVDGDGFQFDLPAGVDHVNNLRGESLTQVDLRLSREFRFGPGLGLEVLAEVFNVLNSDNPARFVGNRTANNFGQATVWAGDPLQPEQRLMQLGLRLRY
jgi:Carboxypeptidase regulatory-like domain/TonB dependent receptor